MMESLHLGLNKHGTKKQKHKRGVPAVTMPLSSQFTLHRPARDPGAGQGKPQACIRM